MSIGPVCASMIWMNVNANDCFGELCLELISVRECECLYRFEKGDVHRLFAALNIPEFY